MPICAGLAVLVGIGAGMALCGLWVARSKPNPAMGGTVLDFVGFRWISLDLARKRSSPPELLRPPSARPGNP